MAKKSKKEDIKYIGFAAPLLLHKQISALKKASRRSMAQQIICMLEKSIKESKSNE